MEFTIVEEPYIENGTLRVEVEHKYGRQNIGLSTEELYINPKTGEPRFIQRIMEMLDKQYGQIENPAAHQLTEYQVANFEEWKGRKLDTKDKGKNKQNKPGSGGN